MKKRTFLFLGLSLAVASLCWAKDEPINTNSQVLQDLHTANHTEIEMGQLAQSQGNSNIVREYGKTLETDHKNADKQVKDLADKLDVDLKDEAMSEAEHKSMAKLKDIKGNAFDHEFANMMVKDHDKDIEKLEAARKNASGDVLVLIDQLLPILRSHKATAVSIVTDTKG